MAMQVILLRHGTRSYGIGDIPLNASGQQEAKDLVCTPAFSSVTAIEASPKKRAQMTVRPLAEARGLSISTNSHLNQQEPHESYEAFQARVAAVLQSLQNTGDDSVRVLCSHSDWLSLAVQLIPGVDLPIQESLFPCAGFKVFEIDDNGKWRRL